MPGATQKDLHQFWLELNDKQRRKFAKKAGTSVGYVFQNIYGYKFPRVETVKRFTVACNESGFATTPEELLVWFYRQHTAAKAPRAKEPVLKVAA